MTTRSTLKLRLQSCS